MRICLHPDARSFLSRAEQWLERTEMEHGMALQSARFARGDDSGFHRPLYWATIEDRDTLIGCAFRTPPYRLGITALPLAVVPELIESVAAYYPTLSGVAGPEPAASAFAAAWCNPRRVAWSVQARQRLMAHRALVPTREPPPGRLRRAHAADAPLARQWGDGFAHESGLSGLDGSVCLQLIPAGRLFFWDDGAPKCMVGVLRETRDAAAIGILFTPAPFRERGYATAAVASFSRHLLERGMTHSYFCLDPSNVVADAISHRLGYAVVQDTVDIDFASA
jgi:hypothetical protein